MKHSLNADRLSAINLCAILALVVICLAFGAAPCAAKIGYISAPSTPDPKSLKATSGNTVVAEVCRTPELRDYMDHGAWYRYIYADPEGGKLLDFEVDEAACVKREAREAGVAREAGGQGK